jgi:hypothetical protein
MYQVGTSINTGDAASSTGSYSTQALGFHFGQMLEYAQTSGTITWYGDNGPAFTLPLQTGLSYSWRY